MQKIVFALFVTVFLLGAPASQAAFVPHPVTVAAPVIEARATTPFFMAAVPIASEKAEQAKKFSFFRKLKKFFTPKVGRNQVLAALLALFLGSLGIHRIYLGYSGTAAVQICLLLLGLALSFLVSGAAVMGIVLLMGQTLWVLIDFIRILAGELKPRGNTYEKRGRKEPLWEEED